MLIIVFLAVGLLLGGGLSLLYWRQRLQMVAEQIKAAAAAEIASLQERCRRSEELLLQAAQRQQGGEQQLRQQQADNVQLRAERAQLAERAARVTPLELQLRQQGEQGAAQLAASQGELRRLSGDWQAAQQLAEQLQQRLQQSQAQAEATQLRAGVLHEQLSVARQQVATLEEQAAQLLIRTAERDAARTAADGLQAQLAEINGQLGRLSAELVGSQQRQAELAQQLAEMQAGREQSVAEAGRLRTEQARLNTALEAERSQAAEKLALLDTARQQLADQFRVLANEILEEKAKRFTEQNQLNIGGLLEPLREKIKEFQGKVEDAYVKETKERGQLVEQVKQLMGLNQQLSQDAANLTRALKGDNKAQGNWGEMILERVLESSGLSKGREYLVQQSLARDDGGRSQPDVIVNLPDGKQLVIDAKMSLLAFERYVVADNDKERELEQKRHVDSLRAHIKGLSIKRYQELYQLNSLDFVLLFVPVEPAFMLAVCTDPNLFDDAFRQNVLIVSPSTLLATMRTIHNLWRQEYQSRNTQEIVDACGRLYDKFVGFVEDIEKLGNRLEQAREAYDAAHGKLSSGRGNLISQVQKVKKLGVKTSKKLPQHLVELAGADDPDDDVGETALLPEAERVESVSAAA